MLALFQASFLGFASIPDTECPSTEPAKPVWKDTFPPKDMLAPLMGRAPGLSSFQDISEWFDANLPALPGPPEMTDKEIEMAKFGVTEYIAARAAGTITCEEYTTLMVKRLHHYSSMNAFMYLDNDPEWPERVIAAAVDMDAKAAADGIDAIAPFYGLPVPAKGTMATVDFKSSAGAGLLHDMNALDDAQMLKDVKAANGIVFGKTNVPEFASSIITCNYANGCTQSPYGRLMSAGGSSGGSGSAVATRLAPIAISEDTGSSTRIPATQNGNFGYDPTRGHYANDGNPGFSYVLDQTGLNARSMPDIIAFDSGLYGYDPAAFGGKSISELRIGVPTHPFIDMYVPACANPNQNFGFYQHPMMMRPSVPFMETYEKVKAALAAAGATLVDTPYADDDGDGNDNLDEALFCLKMKESDELPVSWPLDIFHTSYGQMSQWLYQYLNTSVSMKDLIEDTWSAGATHAGVGFLTASLYTDELHYVFLMQEMRKKAILAWNQYMDDNNLDLILATGASHTQDYLCSTTGTCEIQLLNLTTGAYYTAQAGASTNDLFTLFQHKILPIPKVVVPAGVDADGKPVPYEFLGRGGPVGMTAGEIPYVYDKEGLKTVDADFLQYVKTAVEAVQVEDPSLVPVVPDMLKGEGNLFA